MHLQIFRHIYASAADALYAYVLVHLILTCTVHFCNTLYFDVQNGSNSCLWIKFCNLIIQIHATDQHYPFKNIFFILHLNTIDVNHLKY